MTATGKPGNPTQVKFGGCTSVRIKDNVSIDHWTVMNVDEPKVTLYLGDNNNDSEQFLVKGDNNIVAANVYIPKGLLNVNGNIILMKGWFIAEKVENDGKLVIWNDNNCTSSNDVREFTRTNLPTKGTKSQPEPMTELTVTASPNPSTDRFNLE